MSKRVLIAGVAAVGLSVLAFLVDPVLGSCVVIFGVIGVVVLQLASNWDEHPDYEQREMERARRRAVKAARNREKNPGARERDRARYAAHQAKLAAKREAAEREAAARRAS